MVNKLFNAALQLASYRKSKTQYKRHTVFAHARKTGYNPRYSCWILYAPYANEPKYKQNYKKKTPPLVSVPPSRAGNCNSISLCINSTAIYSMSGKLKLTFILCITGFQKCIISYRYIRNLNVTSKNIPVCTF